MHVPSRHLLSVSRGVLDGIDGILLKGTEAVWCEAREYS
jgi:hypothetical protein